MAKLLISGCKGCGICVKSCPHGALTMRDKQVVVDADTCILCGMCVDSCPFGALSIEKDSYGVADLDSYRHVWVFVEQQDGIPLPVGYELIGKARQLADARECRVVALLLGGEGIKKYAVDLIEAGADEIILGEDTCFAQNLDEPYAKAISELIGEHKPETLLFGATVFGRSVAPRVAARVETGLTADCTVLEIDPEKGNLFQTRPAFGGNLMATIVTERFRPQMATVRPGVLPMPEPDPSRTGIITEIAAPAGDFSRVTLVESSRIESAGSIADAEIIVAAGRGIDGLKNMALVHELAELIGGAVGCTRAVVDVGWAEYKHQIGQTGLAVAPKLLICCGISGSIQFRAGIGGAETIVAINTDPEAPIFDVAHYKVVGDCIEVVKAMIAQAKAGQKITM